MTVKFDCEFYYANEIQSKVNRNTFDEAEHRIIHECRHRDNHPYSVIAKTCDTNHDFCPYNPKNQNLSSDA